MKEKLSHAGWMDVEIIMENCPVLYPVTIPTVHTYK